MLDPCLGLPLLGPQQLSLVLRTASLAAADSLVCLAPRHLPRALAADL
jgi:hypothetical protein